jgi:trehalose 6-phosphate synthase/phosphatase
MGDDWTDETLFSRLPPDSYSIRIGVSASTARFNLESPEEALALLERVVGAA